MSVNVSDYVRRSAAEHPDVVALTCGDRRLTFAELDARIDEVASALSSLGLVAGHRVAYCLPNSVEAVATFYGALRGGFVAVPVNPLAPPADIAHILDETRPRLVVVDAGAAAMVREAAGDATVVVAGGAPEAGELTFAELAVRASGSVPPSPADPEALALVAYTPDATGRLRGAMLTHRALVANIEQVASLEVPLVSPGDRVLCVLPLFHIFALNAIVGQAARHAATVVLVPRFEPEAVLDLIAAEQITVVPLAPPVIAAWVGLQAVAERFASVRTVVCGAAVLDPDLEVEFEVTAGVAVEQGYGMTEAAPVVATTIGVPRSDGPPERGSVGRALPGIEVRAVDGEVDAAPTDAAELWFRGENLFSGYWPDGADGPDAEGWYHSGDVGFVGADGDIVIVERLHELVTVSGFTVYPFEVEEVLAEAPGVGGAAVVGVPDPRTGEAVRAFVVPAAGADADRLAEAVIAHARERLAAYKVPREVVVLRNLPYSTSGKVEKGRLRAMARSDELGLS